MAGTIYITFCPGAESCAEDLKDKLNRPIVSRLEDADVIAVLITPGGQDCEEVARDINAALLVGKRIVGIWCPGAAVGDMPAALADLGDAVVAGTSARAPAAIDGTANCWEEPSGKERSKQEIKRIRCQ